MSVEEPMIENPNIKTAEKESEERKRLIEETEENAELLEGVTIREGFLEELNFDRLSEVHKIFKELVNTDADNVDTNI